MCESDRKLSAIREVLSLSGMDHKLGSCPYLVDRGERDFTCSTTYGKNRKCRYQGKDSEGRYYIANGACSFYKLRLIEEISSNNGGVRTQ